MQALFVWALSTGHWAMTAFRVLLIPLWFSWAACVVLNCLKDQSERSYVTLRDIVSVA